MDNFNFYPNLIPDVSCSQKLNKAPLESSGAIGSQPCMSGFSVETLESHLPNYVSQSDVVQNNAYSVNPLNQHAVTASTSDSNFISTYNLVNFPLDELDVYLGTKRQHQMSQYLRNCMHLLIHPLPSRSILQKNIC